MGRGLFTIERYRSTDTQNSNAMFPDPDPLPAFSALLRAALGDLLAPGTRRFTEMFAEDGVMEFPYAPPGGVRRLEGRQALAAYLPRVVEAVEIHRFSEPIVHRTQEPGVVILEFGCEGRGRQTGRPYDQRYVSVVALRDGHIVRYLDYWNPLEVLRTMGGERAVTDALGHGREDHR